MLGPLKLNASTQPAKITKSCVSRSSVIPNLAGQSEGYLMGRLQAYREIGRELSKKERRRNIMATQARLLRDDDITSLARYFSSLACN